ncbi:hypothetical protein SSS_05845 [Sarcoptes scabiei]|uniref:Uncharacterized protein n=1 Tax=Sarcoptes scabiei TaxID=52283 RepID=A0A834RCY7_SARSC|nr:hypothetical protein SSS_05845 [Sarcoptes scabiei]
MKAIGLLCISSTFVLLIWIGNGNCDRYAQRSQPKSIGRFQQSSIYIPGRVPWFPYVLTPSKPTNPPLIRYPVTRKPKASSLSYYHIRPRNTYYCDDDRWNRFIRYDRYDLDDQFKYNYYTKHHHPPYDYDHDHRDDDDEDDDDDDDVDDKDNYYANDGDNDAENVYYRNDRYY